MLQPAWSKHWRHIQQLCVASCPGPPCDIWWSSRHQLVGQVKRRVTKIRPKLVVSGTFGRFWNIDKCRSEVAGACRSTVVAVDYVGVDASATFGESRLNSDRIIWLFGRPDLFYEASDVISSRFVEASYPRKPREIWWSSLKHLLRNFTWSHLSRHFRRFFSL